VQKLDEENRMFYSSVSFAGKKVRRILIALPWSSFIRFGKNPKINGIFESSLLAKQPAAFDLELLLPFPDKK